MDNLLGGLRQGIILYRMDFRAELEKSDPLRGRHTERGVWPACHRCDRYATGPGS